MSVIEKNLMSKIIYYYLIYRSSQSSLENMSSMGEPTATSVYWKDDNVKDEGAPDPRTVQFRPGRKPGIHLGRLSK
jgi:hypothetical protein